MCRGTSDPDKVVGMDIHYVELVQKILLILDRSEGTRGHLKFLCDSFLASPQEPSKESWFIRWLIRTTVAAIRLKKIRDHDKKTGSPCRSMIFIDGNYNINAKYGSLGAVISSFDCRALLVADIVELVYSSSEERIETIDFDKLCPEAMVDNRNWLDFRRDQLQPLVRSLARSLIPPTVQPTVVKNVTRLSIIPNNKKADIDKQLKCIHRQKDTDTIMPAHIYIVDSDQYSDQVDIKQIAVMQVLSNLKSCKQAKQLLGRTRRLNCMDGHFKAQNHSHIELFMDKGWNSDPFSHIVDSIPPLLRDCEVNERPYIAPLIVGSVEIEKVPKTSMDQYNEKYYQETYNV